MKKLSNLLHFLIFCLLSLPVLSQEADSVTASQHSLIRKADSLVADYKFERALYFLLKTGDTLNIDILLRIGQCNSRLGAPAAAVRPFERVLEMDSSNLTALNQLGQLYARDGEYAKALETFKHLLRLDPKSSYYCKQAGIMSTRLEDRMTAIAWFRRGLNLNPSDAEASLALGNILFEMERYEMVDSIVLHALSIDPRYRPLLLLRARSLFEQQKYASVVITVNQLLERSDTTALYARLLGVSYFNLREYEKLVTCMSFLLKNRFDQEWIYYYMGISVRELGDVPGSINWFRLAAQKSISENTKTYYSQLGQSYEKMGDYQAAIRAYRAAYDYSKEGILLYHLARNYDVYYKDKATALAFYKKYLDSDDTIRLAREYARKRMRDMGYF